MTNFKVSVYVSTEYFTNVEAETEEEAIEIALKREGPSEFAFLEELADDEWVAGTIWEFPNLGKDEKPEVEEI